MTVYDLMLQFLKDEFAKETDFYKTNLYYQAISAISELMISGTADSSYNKKKKIGDSKNEQMDKSCKRA